MSSGSVLGNMMKENITDFEYCMAARFGKKVVTGDQTAGDWYWSANYGAKALDLAEVSLERWKYRYIERILMMG